MLGLSSRSKSLPDDAVTLEVLNSKLLGIKAVRTSPDVLWLQP